MVQGKREEFNFDQIPADLLQVDEEEDVGVGVVEVADRQRIGAARLRRRLRWFVGGEEQVAGGARDAELVDGEAPCGVGAAGR